MIKYVTAYTSFIFLGYETFVELWFLSIAIINMIPSTDNIDRMEQYINRLFLFALFFLFFFLLFLVVNSGLLSTLSPLFISLRLLDDCIFSL